MALALYLSFFFQFINCFEKFFKGLKPSKITLYLFLIPDLKVGAIRSCFIGSIALPFRAGI